METGDKKYFNLKKISRKPAFFNIYSSKHKFSSKEMSTFLTMPRPSHSIIYVASETAVFDMLDGRRFAFRKNNLLYLPKGINYRSVFTGNSKPEYSCLQVYFHLVDKTGNEYYFNDDPMLLLEETPERVVKLIEAMVHETVNTANSTFTVNKLFYEMLETISKRSLLPEISKRNKKIFPALNYLSEHLGDEISVPYLAKLCLMSECGFRRAFTEATGQSPALYKTTLKIEKAKELIKMDPNISSTNLVNLLGFKDNSYFYKTFRKITGRSLKEYRNSVR